MPGDDNMNLGHLANLAQVSGGAVVALAVVHSVAFAVGRRIGRYNVVDVAWGIGFVAIAAVAAILGHGDPTRAGCCWHSCRSGVCD
jgi:steroid 5-alpha reductase family enzyme